jgi:tetratricopeptide (TPR) repeat protein
LRSEADRDKDQPVGWKLSALATLWVIALTIVGVVVGQVFAGPVGAAIGVVPGALAAVLAGFVSRPVDTARRRQEELADLEQQAAVAQEKWEAVGEPALESASSGPALLLRADQEIVGFTGREPELGALRSWCTSADARSLRIIVGAGGVGKTRLALQVASEWQVRGGEWRRVDAGQEAHAVAAARGVTSGPVLLVVDYAETRTDLEVLLRAVLADPGPIRVLLVARALGEWWDRLIEKSAPAVGRLLTETEPVRLTERIAEDISDENLVFAAVPQFARALKCPIPEGITLELPPHRVPVLVLHTAALVAVLRSRDGATASLRLVVAEGLLDELLEHEARYWRRAAAAMDLPEDGALLKPVVAVATLLGAMNVAKAAELMARVPDLSDASQGQRRLWARWLFGLYPPDNEGRLGSLQPDLLAETHVIRQLAADSDFAQACLRSLSMSQAEHALTVLARAWAHQGDAPRFISEALRADLLNIAPIAVHVAVQTSSALGQLLADAVQNAPFSRDELFEMAEVLYYYPSVALAEPSLAVTLRIWKSLPQDEELDERAIWSNRLGLMFDQLGHYADAVPVQQEAVDIYRELATVDPDHFRFELAQSLNDLGTSLIMMGNADAVSAFEEAVAIRRELATTDPDSFRPDLAQSLSNLGACFGELDNPVKALPIEREAVAIYRELTAADYNRFRPGLAHSLNNLGNRLAELGRPGEAQPIAEEAVAIRRELATTFPDRFHPDLAQSLNNLGNRFAELGRYADAIVIGQEALAIHRELVAVNPLRYRPDVAEDLNNIGISFGKLGHADAIVTGQEAVAIRRELATTYPDRFRPDLAQSLSNLGASFGELGHPAKALPATQEAVGIYRELIAADPDRFRPALAHSLSNLGNRLAELGRPGEAQPIAEEAVAISRELANADPDRGLPGLAQSLDSLGRSLLLLDHPADALVAEQEAVTIIRAKAATNPGGFRRDFVRSLTQLAEIYDRLGAAAQAKSLRNEVTEIAEVDT